MKPSVFTIDVSGRSGRDGRNAGTNGYDQPKGRNASTPSPGQNGLNGESPPHATNGLDGQSGESGENAPDCKVMLYGEPKHLILEGNIQKLCNSYTLNEKDKILIKVRGGNGGNGTPGGRGGHGGDGGSGSDGSPSTKDFSGGNGGNAAPGSNSGSGGNGGHGGDSGRGGNLVLSSSDPRLFLFVQGDCSAGTPGQGGQGGAPGNPGRPGHRGKGGVHAKDGLDARSGSSGTHAARGNDGRPNDSGMVTFEVLQNGMVMERSTKLFHPTVLSYSLDPVIDDGVLEPGEEMILSKLCVGNDGGIIMPESNFSLVCNGLVLINLVLPCIPVNSKFMMNESFRFTLPHVPLKVNSSPRTNLVIDTRIDIFNNEIGTSLKYAMVLDNPIQIASFVIPKQMGYGDSRKLSVQITNISKISYGYKFGAYYEVLYKILLSKDIHFTDQDQQEVYADIESINPGETLTIEHSIMMGYESQYYESSDCFTEIYLRKSLVQKSIVPVQCVPYFSHENDFDVLFFTNNQLNDLQFKSLNQMFNLLKLKMNIWDIDFYSGASFHVDNKEPLEDAAHWIGKYRGKTIILASNYKDVMKFTPDHIFTHFVDEKGVLYDSGFLILNCLESTSVVNHLFTGSPKLRDLSAEEFSDEFRLTTPSKDSMLVKCKSIRDDIEKKDLHHRYKIKGDFNPFQMRSVSWSLTWKYCYGNGSIIRFPVPRSSLLLYTFEKVYPTEVGKVIVQGSSIFRLLGSIIMSLPLEKKLTLLTQEFDIQFKGEQSLTVFDLIKTAIWFDLTKHYYQGNRFSRFIQVVDLLKRNPLLYHKNVLSILIYSIHRLKKDNSPSKWNLFGDKSKMIEIEKFIKEYEQMLAQLAIQFDLHSYEIKTKIENPTEVQPIFEDLFHYLLD